MNTLLARRLRLLADDVHESGDRDIAVKLHDTARELERRRPDDTSRDDQLQLCYVSGCWAWFASCPPGEVWGDDWDDAPYEHNAGDPYSNRGYRLERVAFDANLLTPMELTHDLNSPWSVEAINLRAVAWLSTAAGVPVAWAGCTLSAFTELLAEHGGKVYRA